MMFVPNNGFALFPPCVTAPAPSSVWVTSDLTKLRCSPSSNRHSQGPFVRTEGVAQNQEGDAVRQDVLSVANQVRDITMNNNKKSQCLEIQIKFTKIPIQ